MNRLEKRQFLRLLPLGLFLILCFVMAQGLLTPKAYKTTVSPMLGQHLPNFSLPLEGKPSDLFLPALWQGKVAVINIFASWCEPCRVEHGVLMQLAQRPDVSLYGLAWKDSAEAVGQHLSTLGNPYRAVGMDARGDTTLIFGITGLPETYVLDKQGIVRWKFAGPLTAEIVNRQLLPLVVKLNAAP